MSLCLAVLVRIGTEVKLLNSKHLLRTDTLYRRNGDYSYMKWRHKQGERPMEQQPGQHRGGHCTYAWWSLWWHRQTTAAWCWCTLCSRTTPPCRLCWRPPTPPAPLFTVRICSVVFYFLMKSRGYTEQLNHLNSIYYRNNFVFNSGLPPFGKTMEKLVWARSYSKSTARIAVITS